MPLSRHKDLSLVQSVDFFYPLIDDPYMMGRITLANVLSDIYAVGATEIDSISIIVSAPTELTNQQRSTIVPIIISGFLNASIDAGCRVEIQNLVLNPWCIIGGIASSVCNNLNLIIPRNAKSDDLLVITKPLGTQLATNIYLWMQENNEKYKKIATQFNDNELEKSFNIAIKSMAFLNKTAATLMHKYDAHAATDITGFGLLGHANNLAQFQKLSLTFRINRLPIIRNILNISTLLRQDKNTRLGRAVETSGGLLISLSAKTARNFCKEFNFITKNEQEAFIIGDVVESEQSVAVIAESPEFLEIDL